MNLTHHISLRVMTEDQAQAVRIMEILSRVAAGISFEFDDVFVTLSVDKCAIEIEEE